MKKRKNRTIYGVGISDADYQVSIRDANGVEWRCPFYKVWKNMFARCYSPAYQRNNKTYIGCTIDEKWWSFMAFRVWMVEQDWEGNDLDKDFIVPGNRVYGPEFCMFLSRKVNQLFRSVDTYYVTYKGFYVRLKEFCNRDDSLYTYARLKVIDGITDFDEILKLRERSRQGKFIVLEGKEVPLKDLCNMYGADYNTTLHRISTATGWRDSSIYACLIFKDKPTHPSYDMTTNSGVRYQFTGIREISEYTGKSLDLVNLYIGRCDNNLDTLTSLLNKHPKHDGRTLYTIKGVSRYKEDWYSYYGTSDSRVRATQVRLGIPFEDAVQMVPERVRSVLVNGVKVLVKDFWSSFGIDPKNANNTKSKYKYTFLQTLEHLGVCTDSLEVTAL